MEVVHDRVCALDVHQASITACILISDGRRTRKVSRKFGTFHGGLLELLAWMEEHKVDHVVMEGTGVYWRPIYAVLENRRAEIWVVNARHFRSVKGRKTDMNDAEWLATLLRHGLLRKSFVPDKETRALRDLTRYRRKLVQTQTTEKNRTLKIIETAGIKLATFASDVFGVSGMLMLRAIADGTATIGEIASLARGRLRKKMPELRLALGVLLEEHHRVMLNDQLARLDQTAETIAKYEALIEKAAKPHEALLATLQSIHGFKWMTAVEIFAEVGPDLSSFASDAEFASWSGTCPGHNESAGKRRSARRRRGNVYLQSALFEAAVAATRKKGSYLKNKYERLKARRGAGRALFAIAHKLARAVHRVITTKEPYRDLGEDYLDQRRKPSVIRSVVARLRNLNASAEDLAPLRAWIDDLAATAPAPAFAAP